MERLTKRLPGGAADYNYPKSCYIGDGSGADRISKSAFRQRCVEQLADYEDTKLTPEEIDMDHDAAEQLRQLCRDYDFGRLVNLVEADRAGRLVVLPCKVGDTVYILRRTFDGADVVGETELWWDDIPQLGKTVFLTREAAEKALGAMKDE